MPFKNPHPLYSVWQGMKRRCDNPNFPQFADYGGRGIKVCDRWLHSFANFLADMGERPTGYTLDRINTDLGYSPENCRWASHKEQQRNQRRTRRVTVEGVEYRVIDLADISGMKPDTILNRAKRLSTIKEVLDTTVRRDLSGLAFGVPARKAKAQSATHCAKGHEFTDDNTYLTKEGWKRCRACHNAKMRRRNAVKRAAAI